MKLPTLLITCLLIPAFCDAARLTVIVEGVTSDEGKLVIHLFDKENVWLKSAVRSEVKPATEDPMEIVFDELPAGDYGVYAHHDKNADGQLNKGLFGKPTEPYGFSNDSGKMFGPADWKDAKITLADAEEATLRIHIR